MRVGDTDTSPLEELRVLVGSLHAYADWLTVTGADCVPMATAETSAQRGALVLPPYRARPSSPPTRPDAPTAARDGRDRPAARRELRGAPPPAAARAIASGRTPGEVTGSPAPATSAPQPATSPPALPSTDPERGPDIGSNDAGAGSTPASAAPMVAAQPAPLGDPRTPAGPSDEARRRLQVLATEVAQCTRCGLHADRTQTVFSRGNGKSGLCFIGEGPGADEDAQGFPFVGAAGQLLDKMIAAMGLERDEVYVCNIVKCRPPRNRKPEPDEMRACMPYLAEQLELIDPQVIVALGATAVQGLLGATGGITRLRGNWRLYRGSIAVMPTFHPAYLLRQPSAKRMVWQDLQAVLEHLGRRIPGK